MRWLRAALILALFVGALGPATAATVVPAEIQQPGTQPGEVGNLESPDKCDNCHGGYNLSVEPAHTWRGSMMANAGRDPLFWATLAIAEQDFDGAGDLCIRCHSTGGWYGGRSTPTDGSALTAGDADGVDCDTCHKMTNPDDTEHRGTMHPPFVAKNWFEGYYGSGMLSLWGGNEKLGPYANTVARHQSLKSKFHRSVDFCGSCHDVSNPAVGDLAPGNGAQVPLAAGTFSGALGTPVEGKAAFQNPPYAYGVVERTFSEYKAGALSGTRVRDYPTLPVELRAGAIQAAYDSALVAGTGGDYEDGEARYFSCQTCHLRPVTGAGCNKSGAPIRKDLPLHDMTGGNYWMPDAIQYLNSLGKLRLGGGLTSGQKAALDAGKTRAMKQLSEAVSLAVSGNEVVLTNLTGHKVISGYPEGRRMWLAIRWFDSAHRLIREDGAYGRIGATVTNPANGQPVQVESLLNPYDPNTKVYEAHYAMTQAWAQKLIAVNPAYAGLVLNYDRLTGQPTYTVADLAAQAPGTYRETFHFVLNDYVAKDNRIPPYRMRYDEARRRNALPVPPTQYGNPGPGGVYQHQDRVTLSPPVGAVYAAVDLLYQPTSWEYIQFLWKANKQQNAFLKDEGVNMLQAWLNTGMAAPYVMASATWGTAPAPPTPDLTVGALTTWALGSKGAESPASTFSAGDVVRFKARVVDATGAALSGAQVFLQVRNGSGAVVTSLQGFSDAAGIAAVDWRTGRRQPAGTYSGVVTDVLKNGFRYNPALGVTTVGFTIR